MGSGQAMAERAVDSLGLSLKMEGGQYVRDGGDYVVVNREGERVICTSSIVAAMKRRAGLPVRGPKSQAKKTHLPGAAEGPSGTVTRPKTAAK